MAEWVVGAVMEKVMDSFQEYFKDQFSSQTGMTEELQRLREIHPKIQSVVSAYSQLQIEDRALNKWLWQLRDAIDEADDVLDEIEYRKHEKQVISQNTRKRKAHVLERAIQFGKSIYEIGERAFKGDSYLKRVEEAVRKLDKISAEVGPFLHLLDGKRQEEQQQQLDLREARETGAMPTDNLLGRSMEKEFVMQWLSNLDQTEITNTEGFYKNISLLSVVGHGGMGKTTLLQHVYKDGVTEEFGVKAWVCVSDNFDAKRVITEILESIKKERPHLENLDALQQSLKSEVESKRFLLVLDDIWEDDEEKWKKVLAPLSHGSSGSKILITTRMNSVALMFAKIIKRSKEPLQLKGLEEDWCLQLLNKHAFAGVENLHVHKGLKSITGEMVKKLLGSPLAAKVIGGILNFKLEESYWRKVLKTNIGNLNQDQNALLPILKLSYIYLPKYLQNCFAFCGIFPQDHEFDKEDLVRMWIALGFIRSSKIEEETSLEDTGGSYFDILVRKSFFDEFELHNRVYYKMHDLMHELAQFVSAQEIFRIVDDKKLSIPPSARHLSIQTNNLEATFKKTGEFKNLRSLFLSLSEEAKCNENFMDVLSEIFKASKNIRLLVVLAPSLKKTPDTISCLIHLRYLKLDRHNTPQLPRSVSNLYHLQFLIYKEIGTFFPYFDDFSPRDINNLYNLRYLELPMRENCMIHGIGKLKSLQNLNYFCVKNENGYRIGELEHMKELRQIRIKQLQNIKDAEEASFAKFYDKNNLTDLSLDWGYNRDIVIHDLDEKVLDRIQPCNNLRRLFIDSYMGIRSAMWMNDVSFTSHLEYISLTHCLKWKSLPPFEQLPFLKSLHLSNMPEVEKLEYNMDCMFPCLTELCLIRCPKLQELPSLPTKLQKLKMFGIGWKSCNLLQGIRSCSSISIEHSLNLISLEGGWQKSKTNENCQLIIDRLSINDPSVLLVQPLRSVSSLRSLTIQKNDEFVLFPNEMEKWFLQLSSSLSELRFYGLHSLQFLPSTLKSLSSLNTLYVSDAPSLKLLPELPPSLRELEVYDVESLQCLPSSFSTISSLKHLKLDNIPHLKSLPDLPSSLEKLELEKLESCQCLPPSLLTISSLKHLRLNNIPHLKSLPDLPSSLEKLELEKLESLQCLPSSFSTISSLKHLKLNNIPHLKSLPDLPSSLEKLKLEKLESCQCLPSSLSTISSLKHLRLNNIPHLKSLPDLPSSLEKLELEKLESCQCLPSSLSTISSLKHLDLNNIRHLKSLPDLPSSLEELELINLESCQCIPSSLSTISSLKHLKLNNIPHLKSLLDLPSSLENLELEKLESFECLPSSLSTISSLKHLKLNNIPYLKSLPNLPSSMEKLELKKLESCQCLPSSLSTISSIKHLNLNNIRHLKSLSDLPSSLEELVVENLESLQCLSSSLSTLSSLRHLKLNNIPHLKSLPDLPSSLKALLLEKLESYQSLPSSLSTLSSLSRLHLNNIPQLKSLPDLPSSLKALELERLESLQCLPSYLSTISALWHLKLNNIPHLKSMPDLPSSLSYLSLQELKNLDCLPELPASLEGLSIQDCHPQLRERYKNYPMLRCRIQFRWKFSDFFSFFIER